MGKYSTDITGLSYIRASQTVARILYDAGGSCREENQSDARLICEHAFGVAHGRFILCDEAVSPSQAECVGAVISRRISGEPLQYILGEAWFMGLRFKVRPGILIPRRDSEVLADAAIKRAPANAAVLDMCCGSGCLGITFAAARADVSLTLADISETACDVARENSAMNGVDAAVVHTDLFSALNGRSYDMIICNPPYIPSADIDGLDAVVAEHEPRLALDGGEDGLCFYRRLLDEARQHLRSGGVIALEFGYGQQDGIVSLLDKYGYSGHDILFDMEGRARAAFASWR